MTDHAAVARVLRHQAATATREATTAIEPADAAFARQKAAEFTAAATALERLSGHQPTRPRPALADQGKPPVSALERMLADPARREHEIDNAIDANRDAWDRVGGDIILTNPECRADKHASCDGRGWHETLDRFTECPCRCHRNAQRGGTW